MKLGTAFLLGCLAGAGVGIILACALHPLREYLPCTIVQFDDAPRLYLMECP